MGHDVLIVGTGPAGLAAGAYAGRSGMDVLFFEEESIGGELVNRHTVRSYPGFPDGVPGTELRSKMVEAVEAYDPDVELASVERVEPGDPHEVHTADDVFRGDVVVLATGGSEARLGVPGEAEYEGRGIFYCATCDGPLYQGERIAVVGGGDHAIIDAVFLTEYASEVLLFEAGPDLTADATLAEEARSHEGLDVRTNSRVTEVLGEDGVVTGVRVVDEETGEEETVEVGGFNPNVGVTPNSDVVSDVVSLADDGSVAVDQKMETDVPGIYAVGDVRQDSAHEIAAAVGDGVTAIQAAKRSVLSD